jgi:aspartyl-tRNA(Asn)/glutamyl-tRNA(Gln) amidotransferase subunit C
MNKPPEIEPGEVHHIAKLARLKLNPGEIQEITKNLGDILKYVNQLNEIDTTKIEVTSHAIELPTKYREDKANPGMPATKALQGAPERIGDGFGVPKIVE